MLARFLLDGDIQQDNGLFWHCRSAPFYWGRGNGFAALGLTETLTYLPDDHTARADITDMYLDLLDALGESQRQSGMLPQVLDFPGSYDEFTATCMLGYSIARGLRRGWLEDEWRQTLDLAWQGVAERIDDVGNVVDACASTGVQQNVRDYLDRPAVYGFDDRSGGMALWFALEMERLARGA
jgi:rhamnogalacturonyl hydrolase YesR